MIVGVLAGLWLSYRRAAHKGQAYQGMLLDMATWLVVGGIAGGRVWELLWTWSEFASQPLSAFAIWDGGMSIQGAVLGGLLAAVWFAKRRGVRIWELLDILAPGVLLGQAIGRLGCFLSGDAFGRPIMELPWYPEWLGVVYAPDSPAYAVFGPLPLVPAELFEMVGDLLIVGLLLWYKPKQAVAGRTVLTYAILYSVLRFSLEFLRADSLMVAGFKVAQMLSLATIVVCAWLLLFRHRDAVGAQTDVEA